MDDFRSMLCGVCIEPGRFELALRPIPQTAPAGWVLVDLAAAGLCGTDYHIFEGKHPYLQYPRVIGHELSGVVAQDSEGWAKGQPVVVNPYIACGTCHACRRGKPNCCMSIGVLGVHRDGGMCARIAVPAGNLYDAQGLSLHEAALVEFLAIGAHAVRRAGLGPEDRVLVTGAGPIGLGAALFARLTGAEVHLLDLSEQRLSAYTEGRWFSPRWGVVSSSANSEFGGAGSAQERDRTVRLESRWRYSWPERAQSLTVGDTYTAALGWTRATQIGGLRWSRNFALTPYALTSPLANYTGEATLPSTVELFVNGLRQSSSTVPPSGASCPASVLSRVDLPAPLGPTRTRICPGFALSAMPEASGVLP